MPLSAGDKLGPYEILAPIGKGGMGEVFRAHDPRTGRDVAIKISAERFSERFDREVRAVAALNHPNICTLFDVGPNYLVMEFIEGEAPQGPMPLEEALRIAKQIAEALQDAHEKGITHRDLKPGNIKVKPDGTVKVLDFGLAKITTSAEAGSAQSEHSPTLSMAATQAGVILGTAAYMAPEQAKGKQVDKRADIWAFGIVLHELLTGERLFQHEDLTETLAAVVMSVPKLDGVPMEVRRLLNKCLEKDPKKRLRDIGDVWELLDAPPEKSGTENPAQAEGLPHMHTKLWAAVAAVAVLIAGVLAFVHFRETVPAAQTLRYTIAAPENSTVHSFSISPDGRSFVIAATVTGKRQLYLRSMDALQAQAMPFTEDATYPFWSPDSRYIGFFAQGKLKKISANGGPAQSLSDAPNARGGSWGADDIIVFSPNIITTPIQRVAAAGGVPTDVTKSQGTQIHPLFLPGSRHFVYTKSGLTADQNGIYVASLDGKQDRRILPDYSSTEFAPPAPGDRSGHLLFIREGTLMALPFDAADAQTAGDVVPVTDGVSLAANTTSAYAPVTVSQNGELIYATGGILGTNQMGWYDRSGKSLGPVGLPGAVYDPAISPDEKSMVFRRLNPSSTSDLWMRDLSRGTETRFTSDPSFNAVPQWSPHGDRIVFASNRKNGVYNLYQKTANGSGQDQLLLNNTLTNVSYQWSRDGRFIVYYQFDPKTKLDLWVLPVEGSESDRKPIPFLQTEANDLFGQLSPDSHWMAFTSDRSGKREVYVRPFPPGAGEWPISVAGGEAPRWRADGKEMFFEAAGGKMMSVAIKAVPGSKPVFEAGAPVAMFDAHMARSTAGQAYAYDVTADGKRFLINTVVGGAASAPPLTVVTNWTAALKK